MSEDIRKEKERIGGDWAVAHVVLKRESRDLIRSVVPLFVFSCLQQLTCKNTKLFFAGKSWDLS